MHFHLIDWIIVVLTVGSLVGIAIWTKRYTRSVADFLAANRSAGRYLLTVANSVAIVGAITIVANFEKFYNSGFPAGFWYGVFNPIMMIIALSGFVVYRYRQTRAMTMGQFFEMRYSKKFRIFAGITAWISGIVNYGIFPAVTARFFLYFCGIPSVVYSVGPVNLDLSLGIVMLVFLVMAYWIASSGGQIAVIVTDFVQGQLLNFVFFAILIFFIIKFGYSNMFEGLKIAPEGESMLNPFSQSSKTQDFTWIFFIMFVFRNIYGIYAWQGNQGYYCSAKNAHENRMARVWAMWRMILATAVMFLIPIVAYIVMHDPKYADTAANVNAILARATSETNRIQQTVPTVLTQILPVGLMGFFASLMIAAAISTDDTSIHSWGTLFIQDVYLPLKKKTKEHLAPEKHLKLMRKSMLFVAIFAWFFSMIFPLRDYIYMFFQITGAIYVGGAGVAIIGGLYWSRGTKYGAWFGMITGSVLATSQIVIKSFIWIPKYMVPFKEKHADIKWIANLPDEFPLDGMESTTLTIILAAGVYIIVSLFTKNDPDFSLDKVLHRGKYAREEDNAHKAKKPSILQKFSGVTDEFTLADKILYYGTSVWSFGWAFVYVGLLIYGFSHETDDTFWANYAKIHYLVLLSCGIIAVFWLLFGGIKDLHYLWKKLSTVKRNEKDDGSVVGHQLADEVEVKDEDK